MAHPDLDGLDFVGVLGSGGFADVYAYEQRLPARRVAVKVLRDAAKTGSAAAAFLNEVNAMARLEHPHIVPIHAAGITPDGRPYLVMPLYSGANLADRARSERLSVDEVLRVGVQLGGALETAHRRGLLHSDLKPANVLTSQYGTPGLADFGLAGTSTEESLEVGVSVPWSAPEVLFGTAAPSVRSDVYSLAATLWTLLVGHSPFERPQGQNRPAEILRRIRASPVPPTGRADVPAALEELLERALDKKPAARPASDPEFVRGLQSVESLRGGLPTEPVIGDAGANGSTAADAGAPVTRASTLLPDRPEQARALADTVMRSRPADRPPEVAEAEPAPDRTAAPRNRRPLWWGILCCVLLAVVVAWVLGRPVPLADPAVTITASRAGEAVTFRWTYPSQRADDSFNVLVVDRVVSRGEPSIEAWGAGRVCIRVQVVDAAGAPRGGYSPEGCAS